MVAYRGRQWWTVEDSEQWIFYHEHDQVFDREKKTAISG